MFKALGVCLIRFQVEKAGSGGPGQKGEPWMARNEMRKAGAHILSNSQQTFSHKLY